MKTDKEHAECIAQAVIDLNEAMKDAAEAGLRVDVTTEFPERVGRVWKQPTVCVWTSRPAIP